MNKVTPYNKTNEGKKEQVEEMFDNIAPNYDFLNHLLSLGIDTLWRKKAIMYIKPFRPKAMIDIATGTGDFAFDALKYLNVESIIGIDLSEEMLAVARKKATAKKLEKISFVKGDCENLPYKENTFDAMTAGFGVRNFENLEKGLAEMYRVLKSQAPLVILEVSQPENPLLKFLFSIYFKHILPFIGRLFSKDHRAYSYLPESVEVFPKSDDFVRILKKIGFKNAKYRALTLGICAMYVCEK